jgi:hypothetical protein
METRTFCTAPSEDKQARGSERGMSDMELKMDALTDAVRRGDGDGDGDNTCAAACWQKTQCSVLSHIPERLRTKLWFCSYLLCILSWFFLIFFLLHEVVVVVHM